jgi:hypothetical protein
MHFIFANFFKILFFFVALDLLITFFWASIYYRHGLCFYFLKFYFFSICTWPSYYFFLIFALNLLITLHLCYLSPIFFLLLLFFLMLQILFLYTWHIYLFYMWLTCHHIFPTFILIFIHVYRWFLHVCI